MVKKKDKDNFYVDDVIKEQLITIRKAVTKKDRDVVLVINGEE